MDEEEIEERQNLVEWCKGKANNQNLGEDNKAFTFAVDRVENMIENIGITSESIGDLSQSFNADTYNDILDILSQFRKVKFL